MESLIVFALENGKKRRASKLREFIGASCQIRTDDPPLTRRMLWPTELRRHGVRHLRLTRFTRYIKKRASVLLNGYESTLSGVENLRALLISFPVATVAVSLTGCPL